MCICLVVQCRDRNSLVCVYLCLNHPSLTFPCCLFVILRRTYLLRTDINSVSALILFLCYDTKFHSSALSYINKPHANPHTLVHTDTMIDGYERITWYKIICYFETIDLCVTQWNKSLSEASLQQSISACSPIHRILIMWSIYFLRRWIHRNMASLSRDKYNHIKNPTSMTRTVLWDDSVLCVRLLGWKSWKRKAPLNIIHHLNNYKKDEYIMLFLARYFYVVRLYTIFLHYLATNRSSWHVRQRVSLSAGNTIYRRGHK